METMKRENKIISYLHAENNVAQTGSVHRIILTSIALTFLKAMDWHQIAATVVKSAQYKMPIIANNEMNLQDKILIYLIINLKETKDVHVILTYVYVMIWLKHHRFF